MEELSNAIVLQAVSDYRKALRGSRVAGKQPNWVITDCESFFHSEWYRFLAPHVDGDQIIKAVREQAKYDEWRKECGCGKCKVKCIHRSGTKWFETRTCNK